MFYQKAAGSLLIIACVSLLGLVFAGETRKERLHRGSWPGGFKGGFDFIMWSVDVFPFTSEIA